MPLYRLTEPAEPLVAPAIVAAFDGWIDAGGASTAAADHVARGGEPMVVFDSDLLFDYRSRRPVLDVVDGALRELTWPSVTIRRRRVGRRDLLVLSGAEPDFRWRELAEDVLEVGARLGVTEWVTFGAIPAAAPHTRPVPILATASRPGLLPDDVPQGPQGLLRVPAAALSAIEHRVIEGGLPAVGFFAQVPHYVGGGYPAATIAILEHASRHLGIELPLEDLPDQARTQRQRLEAALEADEDSAAYVARLEAVVDNQQLPTGDELVNEIERFLQQREGGPPGQTPLA
ncbi:MAG TPA: PAC2 family protein [Actinomycetota bacterium]|nr:PAC2 family protein [Actinomycetota bacterium]